MENTATHDDLEILEELKQKFYKEISQSKTPPKVGELLKVIEMKSKLSVAGKAEKKFWEMINKIRQEELSGSARGRSRKRKRSK
jgi:hypothetical protein